ncbi:MAG TPA: iron-containing alcohol dehydrogenase [Solirubrobacteraceae bacterium]|jgi:shikimate kinase/3-dehydroquinate synthase|nr:iron-containing alcohol dehydrogenase [Solirubrobacteraceae bacterium]
MALVLIGFMGAGKTTAARELADALGVEPQDSDALLAERFGRSPAEMFAAEGEATFRAREDEAVVELLSNAGEHDVVALGGGSAGSARVRELLRGHVTVLLDVLPETAWERVQSHGGADRPLARDPGRFAALHAARAGTYEAVADAILPELPRGGARRALGALGALARAEPGTRMLWASAASGEYPVYIREGLLAGGDGAQVLWPTDRGHSRAFCVTDETVAPLYGDRLGELAGTTVIPPGEQHKTLATAERVWSELIEQGVTRADHLVALGGGVVGDLAGFCAATYQRGVPVVQVPTTLVAQVDSAYGGKTGVDLPAAKNYIGAYHQPAGVIVDPGTLATLPPAELAAGWVEVYKTALLAGGPLWESLSRDQPVDGLAIERCVRMKLAVVAADERDAGARQMLNLGHTVGHAIETATGYARYRHGEAVGLGLLVALRLSGLGELREQTLAQLAAHGLPVRLEGASAEEVQAATARDKKRIGARVPFVLLKAPGEPLVGCEVDPGEVLAAIEEIAA